MPSTSSSKSILAAVHQPWRTLWDRPFAVAGAAPPEARGDGQPMLAFPMFGAGPESTARLRQALNRSGFSCHDWGHGVDAGPRSGGLRQRLRRIEETLIDVFETERETVTLIGWGLSGLYAREVAKRAAPLVRQVITLGTPFNVGAGRCDMLRALYDATGAIAPALAHQLGERPPVPCTSLYSMSDSVVPWQMSVAVESPTSQNVQVSGVEHRDLADHPKVRKVIADRLAQAPDAWRAFGT